MITIEGKTVELDALYIDEVNGKHSTNYRRGESEPIGVLGSILMSAAPGDSQKQLMVTVTVRQFFAPADERFHSRSKGMTAEDLETVYMTISVINRFRVESINGEEEILDGEDLSDKFIGRLMNISVGNSRGLISTTAQSLGYGNGFMPLVNQLQQD